MKRKFVLVVLLLFCSIFCFGGKWIKETGFNSWGEVSGTTYRQFAQIVNTSNSNRDCDKVVVFYVKQLESPDLFCFCIVYKYIAPLAFNGCIEIKDGPTIQVADIDCLSDQIHFYIRITLEQYRKEYEGKLVQIRWDNNDYVTIKAPIWEE